MNRTNMLSLAMGVVVALVAACAPNFQNMPEESVLEGEGRDPQERELNREALEELRARAEASEPAEPPPEARPLEVVVVGPPPALTEEGELKRSALDEFLARGPHAVLTAVTLEPERDDADNAVGFRIAELHEGSGFVTGAGLRVGDIVTRVNGRSIVLPDGFMAVWEGLATAEELTVELLRDGERSTFIWPIRQDL